MAVTDDQVAALRAYLIARTDLEATDAQRQLLTLSRTSRLEEIGALVLGAFAAAARRRLRGAGIEQTPHRLARHLGDQVVVAVDVQHLGTVQFGGRGDDQVRNRATVAIAAMLGKQSLDLQRSVHRRLANRQPLQCPLAREQSLQVFLVPRGVADLQRRHVARRDDVRAAQRQERGPGAYVSPGPFQRGLVREQHAQPRPPSRHAPRSASSDRSVPVSSRSSSMRAAARWFATRRRAAFTVATLLVVPSSSLASDSASSSRSTTVLDIRSSMIMMSSDEIIVYQHARVEHHHQGRRQEQARSRPGPGPPGTPGPPQWPRGRDLRGPGLGGGLNQIPKNCFSDVLPAGAAATMSARAWESAMTAK